MLTNTPLDSLIHFDFNNNVHMLLVLALVVVLFVAVRTVYKDCLLYTSPSPRD